MTINNAKDLVGQTDLAIIVFTKGDHFEVNALGSGETGDWVVNLQVIENVNKVIIYFRDVINGANRLYLGNYSGVRKSSFPGRHIIRFSNMAEVGTTASNWNDFAHSGQNPVSYVGDFF